MLTCSPGGKLPGAAMNVIRFCSEIHVIILAEYRPARCKHPLQAAADGPASVGVEACALRETSVRLVEQVVIVVGPSRSTLYVTESLRNKQIADPGSRRSDKLCLVVHREHGERRQLAQQTFDQSSGHCSAHCRHANRDWPENQLRSMNSIVPKASRFPKPLSATSI